MVDVKPVLEPGLAAYAQMFEITALSTSHAPGVPITPTIPQFPAPGIDTTD